MKLSSLAWEAAMRRAGLFIYALVLIVALPTAVRADEPPETLELAEGRFRVTLEWVEEPAGESWVLDLGGDGGMFGATDGGEVARLEVAEKSAGGRLRATYRVNERAAAFVVTDLASGVTRRFPVSGSGVLDLDLKVFAAAAAAKVTPVLDTARAVSKFVGPKGGVVTATDARGATFTLILPQGALLAEYEIRMTPLSSLGGFPFTPGFTAAVALEPEGLRLWKLATLKVATPAAVPAAERVPFGYRAANQELFLLPTVAGSVVSLPVTRLVGFGVGRGTGAELAAQWKRVPSHPSDRFEQQLAQALSVAGQTFAGEQALSVAGQTFAGEAGEATGCSTTLNFFLVKTFKSLEKEAKAATKSCAAYRAFLRTAKTWDTYSDERAPGCATLDNAIKKINEVHKKGLVKCFNESFDQCVQPDTDGAHELLGAYRILKASGWEKLVDAKGKKLVDEKKIGKCVRFDLKFTSNMVITRQDAQEEALSVTSTVPIRQADLTFMGIGFTSWIEAKCTKPPKREFKTCKCDAAPTKTIAKFLATLELLGSSLEFDVQGVSIAYDRWLYMSTEAPTYREVVDCGGGPLVDPDKPDWFVAWYHNHTAEMRADGLGGFWLIRGWSDKNPRLFEKVYKLPGRFGTATFEENSNLFLTHKPQR